LFRPFEICFVDVVRVFVIVFVVVCCLDFWGFLGFCGMLFCFFGAVVLVLCFCAFVVCCLDFFVALVVLVLVFCVFGRLGAVY